MKTYKAMLSEALTLLSDVRMAFFNDEPMTNEQEALNKAILDFFKKCKHVSFYYRRNLDEEDIR